MGLQIWLLVARERASVALATAAAATAGTNNRSPSREAASPANSAAASWPPSRYQRLRLLRRVKVLSEDEPLLQLAACLSPWQLTLADCGKVVAKNGEGSVAEPKSIAAEQELLLPFPVLVSLAWRGKITS